jgi:hypothetical protein
MCEEISEIIIGADTKEKILRGIANFCRGIFQVFL